MPDLAERALAAADTIVVVGLSTHEHKEAHAIPAAMQAAGYRMIPVHPSAAEILGERAYRSLDDVTESVDIVNVFRPAAEAPGIARQAVRIGAKALWLQQGIVSEEARSIAEQAGLDYVEDRCMGVVRAVAGLRKN
ncbi:MAG: CoA-binding protein [Sciscionella sp.]